ncbi:MAG: GDP-mannose 4,6-dehydratase [Casimicrobiaceae bacterium]
MIARATQRLLVTGRSGFVGETLSGALATTEHGSRWSLVDIPIALDLRDRDAIGRFVEATRPDAVLHLAAQSAVPESFRDPEATLQINCMGTLHLLQALAAVDFRGRLLYIGTGEVYGLVPEMELPVAETRLPRPRNPYAVSKLAAEALCWQWHASHGLDVVLARPFNHIGAGQSDRFAVSDFAHQIAAIKRGLRPPVIRVGDLDVTRDFTDVHDVIEAYFALLERGAAGETYNVCSGAERSMASILAALVELAGVDVKIEAEAQRLRPTEQRRMRGDATKIRVATGWTATTPLRESLHAALQSWEGSVGNA